jgi:hypothetical protein
MPRSYALPPTGGNRAGEHPTSPGRMRGASGEDAQTHAPQAKPDLPDEMAFGEDGEH